MATYLTRNATTGLVTEAVAASTGPVANAIVATTAGGLIDASLIPGGSGGGGHTLQVAVDFGFSSSSGGQGDTARATVTDQPWVIDGSIIIANPFAGSTPDHSPDDVIAEGIVAYIENLVAGVGFDVVAYAPNGSWGVYYINVIGM